MPVEAPAGVVGGGWFGDLGFGLGAAIEALPPPPPRPCPVPVASMAFYDHVLRIDAHGEWWFEALTEHRARRLDVARERFERAHDTRGWTLSALEAAPGATARHTAAVAECVERIAAGELFQASLCLRLEGRFRGSASDAFIAATSTVQPARVRRVPPARPRRGDQPQPRAVP
jgi:para-aminobenzoate synthetase / 4-amino-4-deoxychorismate lyase